MVHFDLNRFPKPLSFTLEHDRLQLSFRPCLSLILFSRRLYGMSSAKYEERIDFLMKFLDLPSRKRSLANMSGGQQRRASLAVALLHEPELLILDEPTVRKISFRGIVNLKKYAIKKHI